MEMRLKLRATELFIAFDNAKTFLSFRKKEKVAAWNLIKNEALIIKLIYLEIYMKNAVKKIMNLSRTSTNTLTLKEQKTVLQFELFKLKSELKLRLNVDQGNMEIYE